MEKWNLQLASLNYLALLCGIEGAIPDQEGESGCNVTSLTFMEEIAMAIKTAGDVMKFAKDNKIEIVDLKFCDVPGLWQHFSVSANEFGEDVFEDGIGFDGSSIRGFQTIDESDMLLIPDPESAFLDPFADVPTVGGVLQHAHALCAFVAPTTNSYRRLVPGYEAPINIVYSQRNRSAAVRIPMYSPSEKSKRLEFRTPDPSCNPYYAFAAMLMAGLDGIANKIEPPPPIDKNLYDLPPKEAAKVKSMPGSLDEALHALEEDHAFLLKGDVFTRDVIETWLAYKREKELDAIRLRPHPHEFALYFDI